MSAFPGSQIQSRHVFCLNHRTAKQKTECSDTCWWLMCSGWGLPQRFHISVRNQDMSPLVVYQVMMWPQASARCFCTDSAIAFHQLSSSRLKLEHIPSVFSSRAFPWINSPQSCFEMLGNSTSPKPEWSATTVWPQTISGTAATGSGFSRCL